MEQEAAPARCLCRRHADREGLFSGPYISSTDREHQDCRRRRSERRFQPFPGALGGLFTSRFLRADMYTRIAECTSEKQPRMVKELMQRLCDRTAEALRAALGNG
jgi:hypothetical protein